MASLSLGLRVFSAIIGILALIAYLFELGYIIYLFTDAFNPQQAGSLALVKCPDYYNDTTGCVHLWRISTGLSFFIWIDGLAVTVIVVAVTSTCKPFVAGNYKSYDVLLITFPRSLLEMVIFLFAWIEILSIGIELTTTSITFSVIGAAIIPWILAANDILKDGLQ